jgi:hypothetical protein
MNNYHTILWTNDYCKKLRRAGDVGKPLRVLFGGSHQSQPSLSAFGVGAGDTVIVLRVDKGRLFIVASLQVREYVSLRFYLLEFLRLPESHAGLHLFQLESTLANEHPEWGHLLPWGCLTEVALGDGTPIDFERAIPVEVVERIRFTSRRGERPIKHLEEGLIKRTLGLQGGAYRLSENSAAELMGFVSR